LELHRDGKYAHPWEHRQLCDRGERTQPTKVSLQVWRGEAPRCGFTERNALCN